MYRPNTGSVQPKVVNGKTYCCLVESGRVGSGGKPRIVSQRYPAPDTETWSMPAAVSRIESY